MPCAPDELVCSFFQGQLPALLHPFSSCPGCLCLWYFPSGDASSNKTTLRYLRDRPSPLLLNSFYGRHVPLFFSSYQFPSLKTKTKIFHCSLPVFSRPGCPTSYGRAFDEMSTGMSGKGLSSTLPPRPLILTSSLQHSSQQRVTNAIITVSILNNSLLSEKPGFHWTGWFTWDRESQMGFLLRMIWLQILTLLFVALLLVILCSISKPLGSLKKQTSRGLENGISMSFS